MKTRSEETRRRLDWLLNLERRPRTLNGHYYSDYRDKFLAYYKGCRHSDTHGSLIHSLEGYRGPPNSMSMSLSGAKADSSVKDTAESVTEDAKATVNEIKDQINGTQNEKKDGQA